MNHYLDYPINLTTTSHSLNGYSTSIFQGDNIAQSSTCKALINNFHPKNSTVHCHIANPALYSLDQLPNPNFENSSMASQTCNETVDHVKKYYNFKINIPPTQAGNKSNIINGYDNGNGIRSADSNLSYDPEPQKYRKFYPDPQLWDRFTGDGPYITMKPCTSEPPGTGESTNLHDTNLCKNKSEMAIKSSYLDLIYSQQPKNNGNTFKNANNTFRYHTDHLFDQANNYNIPLACPQKHSTPNAKYLNGEAVLRNIRQENGRRSADLLTRGVIETARQSALHSYALNNDISSSIDSIASDSSTNDRDLGGQHIERKEIMRMNVPAVSLIIQTNRQDSSQSSMMQAARNHLTTMSDSNTQSVITYPLKRPPNPNNCKTSSRSQDYTSEVPILKPVKIKMQTERTNRDPNKNAIRSVNGYNAVLNTQRSQQLIQNCQPPPIETNNYLISDTTNLSTTDEPSGSCGDRCDNVLLATRSISPLRFEARQRCENENEDPYYIYDNKVYLPSNGRENPISKPGPTDHLMEPGSQERISGDPKEAVNVSNRHSAPNSTSNPVSERSSGNSPKSSSKLIQHNCNFVSTDLRETLNFDENTCIELRWKLFTVAFCSFVSLLFIFIGLLFLFHYRLPMSQTFEGTYNGSANTRIYVWPRHGSNYINLAGQMDNNEDQSTNNSNSTLTQLGLLLSLLAINLNFASFLITFVIAYFYAKIISIANPKARYGAYLKYKYSTASSFVVALVSLLISVLVYLINLITYLMIHFDLQTITISCIFTGLMVTLIMVSILHTANVWYGVTERGKATWMFNADQSKLGIAWPWAWSFNASYTTAMRQTKTPNMGRAAVQNTPDILEGQYHKDPVEISDKLNYKEAIDGDDVKVTQKQQPYANNIHFMNVENFNKNNQASRIENNNKTIANPTRSGPMRTLSQSLNKYFCTLV